MKRPPYYTFNNYNTNNIIKATPAQRGQPDRMHQSCSYKINGLFDSWFQQHTKRPQCCYFKRIHCKLNNESKPSPASPARRNAVNSSFKNIRNEILDIGWCQTKSDASGWLLVVRYPSVGATISTLFLRVAVISEVDNCENTCLGLTSLNLHA